MIFLPISIKAYFGNIIKNIGNRVQTFLLMLFEKHSLEIYLLILKHKLKIDKMYNSYCCKLFYLKCRSFKHCYVLLLTRFLTRSFKYQYSFFYYYWLLINNNNLYLRNIFYYMPVPNK